jgi:hypothetical protein
MVEFKKILFLYEIVIKNLKIVEVIDGFTTDDKR